MKVIIATPMFDGTCRFEYMISVLMGCTVLTKLGIEWDFFVRSGDQYIGRSRDALVHNFLKTDATDFIFIDSDLGFPPESIAKILKHDVDVVGGAYLKKDDSGFCCTVLNKERHSNGLIKAEMLPTGFLRFRRRVFEREVDTYQSEGRELKQFFPFGNINGRFAGEDVQFCREYDGDIWLDPDITFNHVGTKSFVGNYERQAK